MGVLNVTPDSFSDGGRHLSVEAAVQRAEQMIAEGADVIDVGPESTRPGAEPVPAEEQIARAVPVIETLRQAHPDVPVSIDTQLARVAEAALDAGADLVNDVSALRCDPGLAHLVAERGVWIVLMHMLGEPRTMQTAGGGPVYQDVVREVIDFLRQRLEWAVERGIDRRKVIVDPGIGFGKTVEHNLQLMGRLDELHTLGVPLLVGASRKSFIGRVTDVEVPEERLAGSLACVALATAAGASVIRVHDVAESRRAAAMAYSVRSA
jgi:dihydropteroate synthase